METKKIKFIHERKECTADLKYWDEGKYPNLLFKMELDTGGGKYSSESKYDYYDCLNKIRAELEKKGIMLCCYGASERFRHSRMSRDTSSGLRGYLLPKGRFLLEPSQDLVSVFDGPGEEKCVTIAEQEKYINEWFEKRPKG